MVVELETQIRRREERLQSLTELDTTLVILIIMGSSSKFKPKSKGKERDKERKRSSSSSKRRRSRSRSRSLSRSHSLSSRTVSNSNSDSASFSKSYSSRSRSRSASPVQPARRTLGPSLPPGFASANRDSSPIDDDDDDDDLGPGPDPPPPPQGGLADKDHATRMFLEREERIRKAEEVSLTWKPCLSVKGHLLQVSLENLTSD